MTADTHPSLADRVEQAVLGAVLLRPDVFQDIAYLDSAQFADPARAALFDAIRTEVVRDPEQASGDLIARLQTLNSAPGTLPGLEVLIEACPDPDRAAVYARMLVEADFERTMTAHSDRLWAASEPESQHRVEAIVLDLHAPEASADAEDAPIPGSWKGSRMNREEQILADLLQHPDEFDRLPASIKSESFSADARSRLYEALSAIYGRGEPVDNLTVAWELDRLQRNDILAQTGVDPTAYVERLAAVPVEPGASAELAKGLATTARRVAEREQAATRSSQPGYGPRAQERVIGRDVGRHQAPEPQFRPPTYQPPSPGIDHDGHGPRLGY